MSSILYQAYPIIPFIIDLLVLIPFYRLITIVDTSDYLAIYMIAVNIPFTIRLVPQYINLITPENVPPPIRRNSSAIHPPLPPLPPPPPPPPRLPLGTVPNSVFFAMMSAFIVLSVCYGAFNVLLGLVQEIRRGKLASKWHTWLPFLIMMALIQAILLFIYKWQVLTEAAIFFLVLYYIVVCIIMAVIVKVLLRRNRPNDPTWDKRRQGIESKFHRFLLFSLITVLPSFLYMKKLSMMVLDGFYFEAAPTLLQYSFTEYMFHPWMFNLIGMTLLDPFRKFTVCHLKPLETYCRRYRSNLRNGPSPLPAIYKVPPPSYSDSTITQKKPSRPLQMY